MSNIQTEIAEKLDLVLSGVKQAQQISTRNKERIDSLDKEQIHRIAEDTASKLEAIQNLEAKYAAMEKSYKELEKRMLRVSNGKKYDFSENEKKYRSEFTSYLRKKTPISSESINYVANFITEKTLIGASGEKIATYKKDLVEGVNPDGGYWVRPEVSNRIVTRLFETSPLRQVAFVTTTSSDVLEMIIDDDEADDGGWVGEIETRANTGTPKIGLISIPLHEIYAQPKATQRILDDVGFDIEEWLLKKIRKKMTRSENNAFVVGDGSKKPRGFLTYPAWAVNGVYERGKIEQINSGIAGEFSADGVKALQNALPEPYQANAVFGLKRSSWESIITLKNGVGTYLLDPDSLKRGDTKVLLGSRVIFMHDMPEIAVDSLAMVYADFNLSYTIVDRFGFRIIRDNMTQKPYTKFYTTKRVGGDVTNYDAIKIQKLAV